MQNVISTLVTAICGAMIAVAAIFVMTNLGYMPVNGPQIRNYLLSNPQVLNEMVTAAQRVEETQTAAASDAAIKKVGLEAFFDPRIAFVTGPADAPNTMVEFYDYDCPFCRASLPAVQKIMEERKGNTRFAFIEMPLEQLHGEPAVMAARASLAVARNQPDRFVAFHGQLMGQDQKMSEDVVFAAAKQAGVDVARLRTDMADPDIAKAVEDALALARSIGLDGTPTFLINGKLYPGALDEATFAKAFAAK